ncbi:hypothetical protein F2Q69_00041147 [Brassica cretica]|uniref:Uncharacterized protein n=1 Tax=Brassica cretica TaxID=69181 RepID=A0A8S9NIM8_BRACR|nr:hypothetical protein F2Q69_00041147 [Brassica cretica]
MEVPPIINLAHPARQVEVIEIDDDDILKGIDVEQIVMEHYYSTCTHQPSVNIFASRGKEQPCLPPELCSICSHGVKLGLCLQASSHVEQMKDALLAVSNELLDDSTDLSPGHFEQLCQERLLLKKQIQLLEILIQDKEKKNSECLASRPSHNIQYETPQTTNHKADYAQADSRAHIKEQGRYRIRRHRRHHDSPCVRNRPWIHLRILERATTLERRQLHETQLSNFLRQAPLLLRCHNRLWPPRTNTKFRQPRTLPPVRGRCLWQVRRKQRR